MTSERDPTRWRLGEDEDPSAEEDIRPRWEPERGGTDVEVQSGEEPGDDEEAVELPEELPVLPLKNTVLFPFLLSPLLVNTPRSQKLVDDVLVQPQRLLVCTAVKGPVEGSPGADDVYRVGTVLRVVKMLKFPDDSYRLLVQGVARAAIDSFSAEEPYLRARIHRVEETGEPESVEITALVRNVSQQFAQLVSESPRLSDELQVLAANLEDPSKLADLVASNLDLDVARKQDVLAEPDVAARLKLVQRELAREREALELETEIREKVQSEMGKTQRDYMLRQQLEAIRRELGESEDTEEEVTRLRERIEEAGLPEEPHKQATRELERLAQTPAAAAEHSVIRNYLEWMADLPWSQSSEDRLDPQEARRILDEDHYGLDKVKDRIVEYIAVLSLKRDLKGPILCFVGPPGTGKTSLGRSIARALERQFVRISLGGVRDEAEIRGHRRTYVGALPGRIVQSLKKAGTRNPVFLLDEVDKVGTDFRGDPSSALLEVLDPEQNVDFSDHYLEVPFDLSQVLFIATANWMEPVPPALRDRMEVIELPGYTAEEKLEIARRFLLPRQIEQNGIGSIDFQVPDETLRRVIQSYTREAGGAQPGARARRPVSQDRPAGGRRRARGHRQDLARGPAGAARPGEARAGAGRAGGAARRGRGAGLDSGGRRHPVHRVDEDAGQGGAQAHRVAGRRDARVGGGGPLLAALPRPGLRRGPRHVRRDGHPPARALGRRPQGRPVGGRGDGHVAVLPLRRPHGGPARGDDGRDHAPREGAPGGRHQGEGAGREARGHRAGGAAGEEPQGRRGDPRPSDAGARRALRGDDR